MVLNQDENERLKKRRMMLEEHILTTFNGQEMWYQEKRLQFKGMAHITTDEWGVVVTFVSEDRTTLSLSGRWDFIIAYKNHLGAQYAGWSLDFECPYPEWETEKNTD